MVGPDKVIYSRVWDLGPLILVGAQHVTEEELRIFQHINGIYNTIRLNPTGCRAADAAMQGGKNLKLQRHSFSRIQEEWSGKAQHNKTLSESNNTLISEAPAN